MITHLLCFLCNHRPDMTRWVVCNEGGIWNSKVPRTANPCRRCRVLVVFDTQAPKRSSAHRNHQTSRWPSATPERGSR